MSAEFSAELPVAAPLAAALNKRGYDTLTPVQEAVLAPEVGTRDLLVSAQTGSGKTVAFGLALAPSLLEDGESLPRADAPLALIIAPTRELALQVTRELEWLYAGAGGRIASCVGGMDVRTERQALARGAHIVVGTPGRLVDHIKRRALRMDGLKAVVLDEADEMLKLGFREELEEILTAAPQQRRTLMFSATVSKQIAHLAESYQDKALRLNTISRREQHVDIDYVVHPVGQKDVEKAVINLLLYHDAPTTLVFCARREGVNKLTARLTNRGFSVVALSGEFSQKERSNSLLAIRDGRARVCVATDVAARGIDLPGLDLVIHADLPQNKEALLHRSGRTGRAGRKGASVLIAPGRAQRRAEQLLRDAGVTAQWTQPPGTEDIQRVLDRRVLDHPALSEDLPEGDMDLAEALVDKFPPEKLAAAFIKLARTRQSSPEDMQADGQDSFEAAPPRGGRERPAREHTGRDGRSGPRDSGGRDRAPREPGKRPPDFDNGSWISLGVGRARNADPKWLVPMLCKTGGFERREIGVIKVGETTTWVELKPEAADRIMENAGERQIIDKSLYVARVDGPGEDGDTAGGSQTQMAPRPPRKPRVAVRPQEEWSPAPGDPDAPEPRFQRRPRKQDGAPSDSGFSGGKPGGQADDGKPAWVKKKKGPKKARGPNGEKKRAPGKKKPRG
ncbi:DEAD/DEAH box helicase [Aquisalinus flavus]|uniref:DEAD/DEAH box helicase n=1 Tax=Aquisalinus flavus TaxID=1526572 RepID=A0A8J2Y793_9PROT|nr:DEAD/DEAH box helicase [Aquisalinus flavus]MBD0425938.1 DEAD/DEAH box helicase [Aquisalinus flavus]UNE48468.1 DEAD/DEAH box helicase [Aquisalinus flavus]GGD12040.1 DEAD/DEAH box helicase [Aquisalinus flavus]